jgi:pimeloyl-ACP methyl ester carboxylesterase
MEHTITNPRTGIKMNCLIEGEGEPAIVIIHGWTGNYTRWSPTREMLSKNHRTVIYDLRGHGFSEKRPGMDYSFDSFTADHLGIMEALNIGRAVVAGHSMGGMIAQYFALAHPEMVEKLVLVGTAACPAPDEKNRRRLRGAAWMFAHLYSFTMWAKDHKKRKRPDLYPDTVNPAMRPSREAAAKCINSIINMDLRAEMKNLNIPALVVASTDDDTLFFPLSQELAACIPGARFETVSGCGHHIPIDRAEFLTNVIEDFIQK